MLVEKKHIKQKIKKYRSGMAKEGSILRKKKEEKNKLVAGKKNAYQTEETYRSVKTNEGSRIRKKLKNKLAAEKTH